MARIAGFRAEITADRGNSSRLSYNRIDAVVNDKDYAVKVTGLKSGNWHVTLAAVHAIGSGGAHTIDFDYIVLRPEDMEAIRDQRCHLLMVTEAERKLILADRNLEG